MSFYKRVPLCFLLASPEIHSGQVEIRFISDHWNLRSVAKRPWSLEGYFFFGGGAFDSAKNHKRQRRKRQSVTSKREKSQTPKFV